MALTEEAMKPPGQNHGHTDMETRMSTVLINFGIGFLTVWILALDADKLAKPTHMLGICYVVNSTNIADCFDYHI